MKFTNNFPISNTIMSANIASAAIDLQQIVKMSAQIIVGTGTATGSIQLQVSNDRVPAANLFNDAVFVNWSNLGSATAVTGTGVLLIAQQDMCYRAMRVVYTDSSGGTATAHLTAQLMLMGI